MQAYDSLDKAAQKKITTGKVTDRVIQQDAIEVVAQKYMQKGKKKKGKK